MKTISWDESLAVGIVEMDDDHKDLVELSNELIQSCGVDVNTNVFIQALSNLIQNATLHFCREEALMVGTNYFHLGSHRAEHDSLIDLLQGLRYRLGSEKSRDLNVGSLSFVQSWLMDHIAGFDRAFAEWAQLQGILDRMCLAQRSIAKVGGIAA